MDSTLQDRSQVPSDSRSGLFARVAVESGLPWRREVLRPRRAASDGPGSHRRLHDRFPHRGVPPSGALDRPERAICGTIAEVSALVSERLSGYAGRKWGADSPPRRGLRIRRAAPLRLRGHGPEGPRPTIGVPLLQPRPCAGCTGKDHSGGEKLRRLPDRVRPGRLEPQVGGRHGRQRPVRRIGALGPVRSKGPRLAQTRDSRLFTPGGRQAAARRCHRRRRRRRLSEQPGVLLFALPQRLGRGF